MRPSTILLSVFAAAVASACSPSPSPAPSGIELEGEDGARAQRLVRVGIDYAAEPAREQVPDRVLTNTEHVEDLALAPDALWVATRGGVERYSLAGLMRERVYTTLDGLAANHVWSVAVGEGGEVSARTREHTCTLANQRFHCVPATVLATPEPTIAALHEGARVTARAGRFIGTAGAGVWIAGAAARRLTPTDQICSNHVTAIAEFAGRRWLGSFDDGLCVTDDDRSFARVETPFRMVNELAATPRGLYVAAGAGLFVTRDGSRFERVEIVSQKGVNGLAFDGRSLWVTTPGALWRLRVVGGPATRGWWLPGGSRSLQGVAVRGKDVWLVSEDKGAIRKLRRGFRVYDRAAGAPTSWALAVAVDDAGTAWVGTLRHGLLAIDRRGAIRSVSNLPDDWMLDVRIAGGELFVGTQGGAARIDRRGLVTQIADVPHPNVHAFHVVADTTYVATEAGLLVKHGHGPSA